MEEYGFHIKIQDDGTAKLASFGNQIKQVEEQATKMTSSVSSSFSSIFGGITLGGLASQGISSLFSGIKDEIMDSEKETMNYEKSLSLMKFALKDMGEEGNDAYKSMKNLAESSNLFSPTKLIESETQLKNIGNLSEDQIRKILPLIGDYAATSQKWAGDVVGASTAISTAIQTGATRPIRELLGQFDKLNLKLVKGDATANYAALLQVLGTKAGGADEYIKTMAGDIDVLTTKMEKIKEIKGDNFFTNFWTKFHLGFVEMMHPVATAQLEFKDAMDKEFAGKTQGMLVGGTAYISAIQKAYNEIYAAMKDAAKYQGG